MQSQDETRHGRAFRGLLERYFGKSSIKIKGADRKVCPFFERN